MARKNSNAGQKNRAAQMERRVRRIQRGFTFETRYKPAGKGWW